MIPPPPFLAALAQTDDSVDLDEALPDDGITQSEWINAEGIEVPFPQRVVTMVPGDDG